jgi:hemolysin activation/secretion protein
MKNTILTIAVFAFMTATISVAYGQNPDNKSVNTKVNAQEIPKKAVGTKNELKVAPKDASSEFQNLRKESEAKVKIIDSCIGDLKVYFYSNKIKDKIAFQDHLNLLQDRSVELKKKLTEISAQDQNALSSFKLYFNNEVKEISKSLKDFIANNK